MSEEKAKLIELDKLKISINEGFTFSPLVESRLVDEQGLRISGMGILIKKIEKLTEMVDKTNLKLHFIEKKLEK